MCFATVQSTALPALSCHKRPPHVEGNCDGCHGRVGVWEPPGHNGAEAEAPALDALQELQGNVRSPGLGFQLSTSKWPLFC